MATGLLGMMGNKGGAAIRFKLLDSSVCFVCSHLAAHRENVAGRNADFHKWVWCWCVRGRICDNLRFRREEDESELGVMDHDLVFWVGVWLKNEKQIGDLNYRITSDVPTLRVFDYARGDLEYLLKKDQVGEAGGSEA